MDDSEIPPLFVRSRVSVVEALRNLRENVKDQRNRQNAPGTREFLQYAPKVQTVHVLHRQIIVALDLPHIEHLNDVSMTELNDQTPLIQKALHKLRGFGQMRQNAFDYDALFKPCGPLHTS
jgi:hypothetical protein